MEQTPPAIKNLLTLHLLVKVLEEHGIMTEKELQKRLTNTEKLSSMESNLKEH